MRLRLEKICSFSLIAILCLLAGCNKNLENTSEYEIWQEEIQDKISAVSHSYEKSTDSKNRTWYEIFVYSFNDTNGDGIGDLNGITQMLDYIEYLGFNGIWLTPIHPSTTYHKYDVKDYYNIDPQYGSLEDFESLSAECDKRGIALILDLVVNHTSSQHEWFKEAVSAVTSGDESSKYIDYYNFADNAGNGQWKAVGSKFYECRFWSEMPDLNLESLDLRAEFEKIFNFWLDKGVDGFRLDAAGEYVTGNSEKNIEILSWINQAVKGIKPEAYLVGEVWEATTGLYDYYRSGIDSFFDFNFAAADGNIAKTLLLKNQTANSYINALLTAQEEIKERNPNATDAHFFTNHDTARAGGFLKRDSNFIKMAWGMNLTQSGNSFVYYGEEIGMMGAGIDPNKRAPMYWTSEKSADGITYGPPEMGSVSYEFPSVIEQIGDDNSILEYIRKAIALRKKYPEIAAGEITSFSEYGDKSCVIYKSTDNGIIGLCYNFSDKAVKITIETAPMDWLSATGEEPVYNDNELLLPPYTIALIN